MSSTKRDCFRARSSHFSAEFGLHESLPIYSGGLGILAGDHLKSASDLELPLVGVGIFYRHGYLRDGLVRAQYIEVPGMGHASPSAEWFERGIEALEQVTATAPGRDGR